MPATDPVVLLAALYDPDGRIGALLPAQLPAVLRHFTHVAVLSRPDIPAETRDRLFAAGVHQLILDPELPANPRPTMLRLAAREGWAHVHLGDLDSALHWANQYPDELDAANETLCDHDFTVFGRTARAIATLPPAQRSTEAVINEMFAAVTGGLDDWWVGPNDDAIADICTGAWGFSRRGVEALAARATVTDIGFHAEWPLLARDTPGLRCAYLPTDGMEYETADRYGPEIAAAGGLDAWRAAGGRDLNRWRFRLGYVQQVADFLAVYHTLPGA